MAELTESALRPSVPQEAAVPITELYAALHDARARLFREGRVCVEPQLAVALRAEIGRLTAEIRRREAEGKCNARA